MALPLRRGTVARAFELARTGDYESIGRIERKLIAEGCEDVIAHLSGPMIRAQLRATLVESGVEPKPRPVAALDA